MIPVSLLTSEKFCVLQQHTLFRLEVPIGILKRFVDDTAFNLVGHWPAQQMAERGRDVDDLYFALQFYAFSDTGARQDEC